MVHIDSILLPIRADKIQTITEGTSRTINGQRAEAQTAGLRDKQRRGEMLAAILGGYDPTAPPLQHSCTVKFIDVVLKISERDYQCSIREDDRIITIEVQITGSYIGRFL